MDLASWARCVLFSTVLAPLPGVSGAEKFPPSWVSPFGGGGPGYLDSQALAFDGEGNLLIAGSDSGEFLTVKHAPDGRTLWSARPAGPGGAAQPFAVAVDETGAVIVTGSVLAGEEVNRDFLTVKYSSQGEEQWSARYDGPGHRYDSAAAVVVDRNGNLIVAGSSDGFFGTGASDVAVVKYDPRGGKLWEARYDGPDHSNDGARFLKVDDAGNIYVTGYSYQSDFDIVTLKYSPGGEELWTARFDGPDGLTDFPNALAVDAQGQVYVCGFSEFADNVYPVSSRFTLVKYSPEGRRLWAAHHQGPVPGPGGAAAMAVDGEGNAHLVGWVWNGVSNDLALVKYDPDRRVLWNARYDGPEEGNQSGAAIELDGSGDILLAARAAEGAAAVKYDRTGRLLCAAGLSPSWVGPGQLFALRIGPAGGIYLAGSSPEGLLAAAYPPLPGGTCLSCPEAGDTHLTGLEVSGADFAFGPYFASASASDESGDPVHYTFVAESGYERLFVGPQTENTARLDLTSGRWTVRVRVDDDPECPDEADDALLSREVFITHIDFGPFRRMDCDGDGRLDIVDPIYLFSFNFLGSPEPPCLAACDANGDGEVTGSASDGVYILQHLFLGGPRPPQEYPFGCGFSSDRQDVDLGCRRPTTCH